EATFHAPQVFDFRPNLTLGCVDDVKEAPDLGENEATCEEGLGNVQGPVVTSNLTEVCLVDAPLGITKDDQFDQVVNFSVNALSVVDGSELSDYEENEEGDQNFPPAFVQIDSRVSSKVMSDKFRVQSVLEA
ncbi:hypothetical protein U1Q18_041099, partial [Sarracenia purpurea var. burkii]